MSLQWERNSLLGSRNWHGRACKAGRKYGKLLPLLGLERLYLWVLANRVDKRAAVLMDCRLIPFEPPEDPAMAPHQSPITLGPTGAEEALAAAATYRPADEGTRLRTPRRSRRWTRRRRSHRPGRGWGGSRTRSRSCPRSATVPASSIGSHLTQATQWIIVSHYQHGTRRDDADAPATAKIARRLEWASPAYLAPSIPRMKGDEITTMLLHSPQKFALFVNRQALWDPKQPT